ncbi:MAG TPA: Na+/H+ antiporter [Marmoricola sp.]
MHAALILVCLAAAVLVFTAAADRLQVPAPLLLIAVGIAGSYVPGIPQMQLGHDVVLFGLLPPLLYAAAVQTSLVDFNANRRSILLLSIGLVVFSTFGVGWVVHEIVPDIRWPAELAIGAVVAPPDAVAATAVARRIGLPRRVVTILEGESLLNDATALVALRTAIAAAAGGVNLLHVGGEFVWAAIGGVLAGLIVFVVVAKIRKHLTDPPVLDTAISLVIPFVAYVLAESVHASGVLGVVVAGLLLGHEAPILQTAQSRIAERTNWRTIAFLLENAVFLLIGLQAQWILDDVRHSSLGAGRIVSVCAATLVAVIVLRIVWVFASRALLIRPLHRAGKVQAPWRSTFLISWAGMRGVVTLAAAFVIPTKTEHREVLLLIAFTVVVGTLFLQGLSLPVIARLLKVPSPDARKDALARANLLHQASTAGMTAIDACDDPYNIRSMIRDRVEQRGFAAWEQIASADAETPSEAYARMRHVMIDAERARVLEARGSGEYPHEVVQEVLGMLDVEESMLERTREQRAEMRTALAEIGPQGRGGCEHLREARDDVEARTPGQCEDCIREGTTWVHLRVCLTCGHVGCCDSSPMRHATAHFHETGHPVMRSAEEGETWRWCFVDELTG